MLRIVAIVIEVLILAVIAYAVLEGIRLAVLDLGVGKSYHRAIGMALLLVGAIILVFFIVHLTTFYPE